MATLWWSPFTSQPNVSLQTYAVGNSLTEDSQPHGKGTLLAADSHIGWRTDYHIQTGQPLAFLVANPGTFIAVQPSQWNIALPAVKYGALIAEPWIASTIGAETSAFLTLVASIQSGPSVNPKYFMYETWPQPARWVDPATYQTWWAGDIVDADSTTMTQQLAAMNAVYTRLQATLGKSVYVIPAGSVFNAIDASARAGNIPGVTKADDLYRDPIHMGEVGQFVANCTMFSTLFRRQCNASHATVVAFQDGQGNVRLTDGLAATLEAIVWQVVSNDPRAVH